MNSDDLRKGLLDELKVVEKLVRADLLSQYRADPNLMARAMQRLHEEESSPGDSAAWLETFAGRGAVLYILKTLYVRVLEDQGLLRPIRLRDGGTYETFRSLFPQLGHAAYLRRVFDDAERAIPELFAPTPVEIATPSGAVATAVWNVWQLPAPGGGPRFDFRSSELDTRFIGDLYQDLDPEVKARYALLQTPRFIEEFILDRTLDPAVAEFGLNDFRIIDPTCGSGHFLLGAFERLARAWRAELGDVPQARWLAAERALAAVYGADLNEYACAMTRFRLLLAIVKRTGVKDLDQLRTLHINVIACDSLIPWERLATEMLPGTAEAWLAAYGTPEERSRNEDFFAREFHAVVGNPPYIAVKDKKKREDYRLAWPRSASGKYSLSAPMTERFLLLPTLGGRAGIIVANNFCKRSFGKGVVERVLRDVRLDSVVDTSGAYIPDHGTPTVMLFSTRSAPDLNKHKTTVVAGKRGEPREPLDAAHGIVWSSIAAHATDVGFDDKWIAVQRVLQTSLLKHPWSIGSDAVMAIKGRLDVFPRLRDIGADAGIATVFLEKDIFKNRYAGEQYSRKMISGEDVRDWRVHLESGDNLILFPYAETFSSSLQDGPQLLWPFRTTLNNRGWRASTIQKLSMPWWSFGHISLPRTDATRLRIVIGEIATNNQFVVNRSEHICEQTAPVLTIATADEARYREIAGILNSSTLEFWFKQVCFDKGNGGINGGIAAEAWEKYYVRNSTNVVQAPLPYLRSTLTLVDSQPLGTIVYALETVLARLSDCTPSAILRSADSTVSVMARGERLTESLRERLVALQEELDWVIYGAFGLLHDVPTGDIDEDSQLARGHRPFEIALARRMDRQEEDSAWFGRHGLSPVTEFPARYQGQQRAVLERRLNLIENDPTIALLEQPASKRRWTFEPWDVLVADAAKAWLLNALENIVRESRIALTASELTSRLSADPKSAVIAEYAAIAKDTSLVDTVVRLLSNESIPDNPASLLTPMGLTKLIGSMTADIGDPVAPPQAKSREVGQVVDWKSVWRLQEREDANLGTSDEVPPAFVRTDYAHPNGWRIRGKFNIANERFIVYEELTPARFAWGGCSIADRARLSAEVFDLRGRQVESNDAQAASVQPTRESPGRCAIQFPLWDKLDELRRIKDETYADVRELAMLCGRTCPCDVLVEWRKETRMPRGERLAKKKPPLLGMSGDHEGVSELDPTLLDRLVSIIREKGERGVASIDLEPIAAGDRKLLTRALDALRADGRIEPHGRGRATKYRVPGNRLL